VDLLVYIKEFGELFTKNTTKNGSPRMHALFAHCEYYLKTYEMIGLFSGDALKVIHSLVNRIGGAFQLVEGDSQTKQVLRLSSAESDHAM
jgi:hypothetical protein